MIEKTDFHRTSLIKSDTEAAAFAAFRDIEKHLVEREQALGQAMLMRIA